MGNITLQFSGNQRETGMSQAGTR